jgi:Zn-dependent protease
VTSPAEQAAPVPGSTFRRNAGWLAVAGLGVLAKGKTILGLLKALPAAKFLLTSLSMLAMVWFEALRSGIWFGVGFVMMILVHELGHGYAIKRAGLTAGWPVFIPFFGAMISMKGMPRDRSQEAAIAYGGPLAGTIVAVVAAALGWMTDSRLFYALAYTGFFLNLFNLTPISPLDGGRVAQAFSRRAWIFGAVLLGVMFLVTQAPQLLLIGLLALPHVFRRGQTDDRDALPVALQRVWAFRYFGLAAFLGGAMYFTGAQMSAL